MWKGNMMMKTARNILPAYAFCAMCFLWLPACALGGAGGAGETEKVAVDREALSGRYFQFSWNSEDGGGVNGIALLKADGSIEGIGSPNETTWLIDPAGRLLFKHADGRVSTTYDKVWREEGLLCFQGPFLFREGITHHLIEIEGAASDREHRMTPQQTKRIKYSPQRFAYLDPGETHTFQLKVGAPVKRGQWVAMLGRRGASGNFSHLHVGTYSSKTALAVGRLNRNLNLYPWLVAAYQAETGTDLYAVARPHKTARTGDTVLFDGSNSMVFRSNITFFKWEFHDGTSVRGPKAEKVYEKPGCYAAALWIRDSQGNADVDFCKVKVYSRSTSEDIVPILFVTYKPSREVRVDQPVSFRIWPQGMGLEDIQVDFGDGTVVQDYRPYSAIAQTFKDAGIQIITVTGTAEELPVTQKVKVVVQE